MGNITLDYRAVTAAGTWPLKVIDLIKSLTFFVSFATALLVSIIAFFVWRWLEGSLSSLPIAKHKFPQACRRLGITSKSNLADEHDPIYAGAPPDQTTWKVKSLLIYPIKSCKVVELDSAVTVGTGMCYDRQFAFARWMKVSRADEEERMGWKFLTQREAPLLATIKPEMWVPDPISPQYYEDHPNVRSGGVLVIKYPTTNGGEKTVEIPFAPAQDQIKSLNFRTTTMTIWKDSPDSILMASTENHDEWIEDVRAQLAVKTPLALFRVKSMHLRELYRNAPRADEVGYQPAVGFQDAYPLHIINLASVQDVASKFSDGSSILSARNFRPNIIVAGGPAYAEDYWKRIKIGEDYYYTACRTVRCLLPNVNQETGKRHPSEPNKTLKDSRRIDDGDPKNACLGMQMVPGIEDARTIHVGDEVTVLETGEHFYIKQ